VTRAQCHHFAAVRGGGPAEQDHQQHQQRAGQGGRAAAPGRGGQRVREQPGLSEDQGTAHGPERDGEGQVTPCGPGVAQQPRVHRSAHDSDLHERRAP
jgi:hypothetical protein